MIDYIIGIIILSVITKVILHYVQGSRALIILSGYRIIKDKPKRYKMTKINYFDSGIRTTMCAVLLMLMALTLYIIESYHLSLLFLFIATTMIVLSSTMLIAYIIILQQKDYIKNKMEEKQNEKRKLC